jgi:hypothetical protein
MTFDAVRIQPSEEVPATLSGSWKRPRYWDWNGTLEAPEPIVGLALMQIGRRLEWARSEKGPKSALEVRLLFGYDAPDKSHVNASFSVGENSTRSWTLLADPDMPPQLPENRPVEIGRVFSFCEPFGSPLIQLFGLVLLRDQVIGARNGLWHLKPEFRRTLPEDWAHLLSHGRTGSITIEHEKA